MNPDTPTPPLDPATCLALKPLHDLGHQAMRERDDWHQWSVGIARMLHVSCSDFASEVVADQYAELRNRIAQAIKHPYMNTTGTTAGSDALLASLLAWMPICGECSRLATHEQTWSDRGPIYYCDQDVCSNAAQQRHDGDSLADQTGLERGEVWWAGTVRLIEANAKAQAPLPTPPRWEVMTGAELAAAAKEHEARMDAIFKHDKMRETITINAAYPYRIELARIPDPESLVYWLHHLTEKTWMTSELVREFIQRVHAIKGWTLYRRQL